MAYVTSRKNPNNEILLLFPIPFYTSSRIYYEEDLEQLGLDRVLDGVTEDLRRTILDHARTLANVQPELAFHFLLKFPRLLQSIRVEDLGKWVSVALDLYDSQGLEASREFVLELDSHPAFQRHWGRGVAFQDVYGVLLHYLHALGREDISLEGGRAHYTDIETIYVPDRVFLHSDERLELFPLQNHGDPQICSDQAGDLFPRHEQAERASAPAQGAIPPGHSSQLAL